MRCDRSRARCWILVCGLGLLGSRSFAAEGDATAAITRGQRTAHVGLALGGAGMLTIAAGVELQSEPVVLLGSASMLVGSPLLAAGTLRASRGYDALGVSTSKLGVTCAFSLQGVGLALQVAASLKREETHYGNVTVYGGPDTTLSALAGSTWIASYGCGLAELLGDEWRAEDLAATRPTATSHAIGVTAQPVHGGALLLLWGEL